MTVSAVMLTFCGMFALVQLMVHLRFVLQPFLLAVFFCVLLIPLVEGFQKTLLGCYSGRNQLVIDTIKCLSLMIVMLFLIAVLVILGIVIIQSFFELQEHQAIYVTGFQELGQQIKKFIKSLEVSLNMDQSKMFDNIDTEMDQVFSNTVFSAVKGITHEATAFLGDFVMMLLYVIFWLAHPIKIHAEIGHTLRRYTIMKTIANSLLALCTGFLLWFLGVACAWVFAVVAFILNFIPELGPLIAICVPIPLILADSRKTIGDRITTLILAVVGQLIFKFVFGNILELKLIEQDNKMKMHPVVVLFGVAFFGYLWGPTGMLMSVPLMALIKMSVIEPNCPFSDNFRDYVLIILEGDRDAPERVRCSLVDSEVKDTFLSRLVSSSLHTDPKHKDKAEEDVMNSDLEAVQCKSK